MKKKNKSNPNLQKTLSQASIYISIFIAGLATGFVGANYPSLGKMIPIQEITLKKPQELHAHFVTNSLDIKRSCYSLKYDYRTRNPLCVYECLTQDGLNGNADRKHLPFKEDFTVPDLFRASLSDYKSSGHDRGHLAPAANHKQNKEELEDTFYLSNMCPQCPQFNRGYWAKLERYVRDLTKLHQTVEVYTGPIYKAHDGNDGKRYVRYQVIGKNEVAVPTHFYKLIVKNNPLGKQKEGYVIPNEEIPANTPLERFKATSREIERLAGVIFNNSLLKGLPSK